MTNKTLESRLVASSQGFATMPGHALVVLNERDGGRTLQQTVMPGGKFRKPLLLRGTLLPYHVSLDDHRNHTFPYRLLHVDGVHSFSLQFDLRYRVLRGSPHLLVEHLDADPLGSIEEEIKRVLSPPVRRLDWAQIQAQHDVTAIAVESSSVDDSGELVVNMDRIKIYARSFGIDVRQVAVSRHLEEIDKTVARSAIKHAEEVELRTIKVLSIHDQEREDQARFTAEHNRKIARAVQDASVNQAENIGRWMAGLGDAMETIGRGARSIPEIRNQLGQMRGIGDMIPGSANGHDGGVALLQPAGGQALLGAGARATAFDGPARNIGDVLSRACEVAAELPAPEQRRFLAAVLRLQAAHMVEASDEIEQRRAELLELHRVHAQDMRDDHSDFIADLVRPRRSAY